MNDMSAWLVDSDMKENVIDVYKRQEQRLGTVVACADAHAVHVHDAGDVVRVDAAHVEADSAMVLVPVDGPDDVDEGKLDHTAHGVVDECALAFGDGLVADLVHEVVQRDARGVDARGCLLYTSR